MSISTPPLVDGSTQMDAYEGQVWEKLNEHWERRNNRRGLPNWASTALIRTGEVASNVASRAVDAVPDKVKEPISSRRRRSRQQGRATGD